MNIRNRARLPDRSCETRVVFRGELLNYCPALHALNRPERKRERKNRALFSLGLSLGRSHIMRTYRIAEGSAAEITATVNDHNCDNRARWQRKNEIRNINRILISASEVRRVGSRNSMDENGTRSREGDRIAREGTKVAFPAFWESSRFNSRVCYARHVSKLHASTG